MEGLGTWLERVHAWLSGHDVLYFGRDYMPLSVPVEEGRKTRREGHRKATCDEDNNRMNGAAPLKKHKTI
jgi:hypothetical protein